MKVKALWALTGVVATLSLAGCTSFQLRDANDQLTTYYYAKQEAQRTASFPLLESALASLGTLTENSLAAARQEGNVLNQIAFYRIATTAAWQAGDPRVVQHAGAGQTLCAGAEAAKAPRDCGMLAVIPSLASVDQQTAALEAVQDKVLVPGWQRNEADREAVDAIYTAYRDAFDTLMRRRPALKEAGAHHAFLTGVDSNVGTLLCGHVDSTIRGLLGKVGSPTLADGTLDREVDEMKCTLVDAGVDPTLAPCITGAECN